MVGVNLISRAIWRATGNEFPEFPIEANSRHLRKCSTALAHLYGDSKLRGSVHEALNHSQTTNSRNYQNLIRRHTVTNAKMDILALRPKSTEMKSMLLQANQTPKTPQLKGVVKTPSRERRTSRKPMFLEDFVI